MRVHHSGKHFDAQRTALRNEFHAAPDEQWLDRKTVAAGIGMSTSWLEKRPQGQPPFKKVGGHRVRYRKRDVLMWWEQYLNQKNDARDSARPH